MKFQREMQDLSLNSLLDCIISWSEAIRAEAETQICKSQAKLKIIFKNPLLFRKCTAVAGKNVIFCTNENKSSTTDKDVSF